MHGVKSREFKEPWEEAPHIWKTKAAFFNFLRGNLRRAVWEKWPLKFEFKDEICEKPPEGYKGRAKTGAYCALSGKWTGKSAAEVDHITGNVSLQDWDDVLPFIQHLCASKESMQFVSKEAHQIKSYAEKHGLTYQEAAAAKSAIAIMNSKKEKEWLKERGIEPGSNAAKRRKQVEKELLSNG